MTTWATARTRGHLAVVDGFRGVVTASFRRAVYITPIQPTATSGHLLVVHHVEHGPTPTSLLVDDDAILAIAVGAPVAGRARHLRFGDLVVDVRTATVWTPAAPPRSGVLATPVVPADESVDRALVDDLVAALAASTDTLRLTATLGRLVGHGVGVTPSGDDAIVGVLAVLHRATPPAAAAAPLAALERTLPALLDRTSPISAHFLRLALRGEFGQRLVAVVDGCCRPSGPDVDAIDRLLATGATSGADALVGVAAAAEWFRAEPVPICEEVA